MRDLSCTINSFNPTGKLNHQPKTTFLLLNDPKSYKVRVARVRHTWVEFVVGSIPHSKKFFSWGSGFPLFPKTNSFKFQFYLENTDTC